MRAIDDDVGGQLGFAQCLLDQLHADRIVIRSPVAAAQDDVAVAVATGAHDGGAALAVDAEEAVRARGGDDGVEGDADVAVGAVLEADRRRQAGGHFAVRLRFGDPWLFKIGAHHQTQRVVDFVGQGFQTARDLYRITHCVHSAGCSYRSNWIFSTSYSVFNSKQLLSKTHLHV